MSDKFTMAPDKFIMAQDNIYHAAPAMFTIAYRQDMFTTAQSPDMFTMATYIGRLVHHDYRRVLHGNRHRHTYSL